MYHFTIKTSHWTTTAIKLGQLYISGSNPNMISWMFNSKVTLRHSQIISFTVNDKAFHTYWNLATLNWWDSHPNRVHVKFNRKYFEYELALSPSITWYIITEQKQSRNECTYIIHRLRCTTHWLKDCPEVQRGLKWRYTVPKHGKKIFVIFRAFHDRMSKIFQISNHHIF